MKKKIEMEKRNEEESSSYETTPERNFSSISEPASLIQSPTRSVNSFNSTNQNPTRKNLPRKVHSFTYRVREHVRLGPKITETVKGKLSLGAKIIKEGGRGNIFEQTFGISEGERLLKASQCYLSTSTGPIAGLLFISTLKVAFSSERPITVPSHSGLLVRTPYKVSIPVLKIRCANESQNVNKPSQKYIQIVTEDGFEFWFMGFLRYEKAWRNLQKAISMLDYSDTQLGRDNSLP